MRIVLISDSHTFHNKIDMPPADLLIHAGDALLHGSINEATEYNRWLGSIKFKYKHGIIQIAGNHCGCYEDYYLAKNLLTNCTYLQDSMAEIEGVRIYGSPWTVKFGNWWFMKNPGEDIKRMWDKIPECNILVTHSPPFGILDSTDDGKRIGCPQLRDRVLKVKPKLHVFGHSHSVRGVTYAPHTTFINASVCDETYSPINKPIVIEFLNDKVQIVNM